MDRRALLTSLCVLGGSLGCSRAPDAPPPVVTVFAAASLSGAFTELGQLLEQRQTGVTVRFNFAGSQQLALQIHQGAAADVFASADERWMRAVSDSGLIAGAAEIFAHNSLVVVVPAANPGRIERLEDLTRSGLKLVLAAEAVPVGGYSREALGKLAGAPGFGATYAELVLRNVVSFEESVKGVAAKVQLGEADAGIVYRSDVTPAAAPQVRIIPIPDQYNVVADYPIAVLARARNEAGARAFRDLVLSAEGQAVLERHGLTPARAGSGAPPATP